MLNDPVTEVEKACLTIEEILKVRKNYFSKGPWDFQDPDPQGRLNLKNASYLMDASMLAYAEHSDLKEIALSERVLGSNAKVFPFEIKVRGENVTVDTQGFVGKRGKNIIMAFRGTEPLNLFDWLTDGAFVPEACLHGKTSVQIHRGFHMAFESAWQIKESPDDGILALIKFFVKEARNEGHDRPRIWMTGHSLGGALATIAAARLVVENEVEKKLQVDIGGLYTFGSPRVGDKIFADAMDNGPLLDKFFRVVNNFDIVPRLFINSLYDKNYWIECLKFYKYYEDFKGFPPLLAETRKWIDSFFENHPYYPVDEGSKSPIDVPDHYSCHGGKVYFIDPKGDIIRSPQPEPTFSREDRIGDTFHTVVLEFLAEILMGLSKGTLSKMKFDLSYLPKPINNHVHNIYQERMNALFDRANPLV